MECTNLKMRLLTKELVQILNKTDDDNDGRPSHSNEKKPGQQMHSHCYKRVHKTILPRYGMLDSG